MSKDRVALDLPDLGDMTSFKPRTAPPADTTEAVKEVAERNNFTTRHAPAKPKQAAEPVPATFDARSLRRSNRTAKLNIATTEANRERFWTLAQPMGITSGDAALAAMMDALEAQQRRAGGQ